MIREHLSAELEAALVRALLGAWHTLNANYFRSALSPPVFLLMDGDGRLGEWRPGTRTIALQRSLVLERPWGLVVEVLKHEIAHQYVSEVLRDRDGTPHGPAFRLVCDRLGIDGRASGMPAPPDEAAPGEDEARILGRIAKLLALAQSQNRHEAETAMARAQELMLKHNLTAPPGGRYGFRHLGAPTGRIGEAERILANLLGDHFFVEIIFVSVWRPLEGKRGGVLEVTGSPVNLEMAAYVYDFLQRTAERLWGDYKRVHRVGSNRDRRTFVAGVMAGFRDKLRAQARTHEAEGLVWVGDADLSRYHRRRHPYVRRTYHVGQPRNQAHAHGRAAGQGIVLSRPVASRGEGGRLLAGRKG